MDNNMPVMDGCDSSAKIRAYLSENNLAQPIIIAVTGQTEDSYVKRAYISGINAVCAKPMDLKMVQIAL